MSILSAHPGSLCALGLLLAAAAAVQAQRPAAGTIQGIVVREGTSDPLPGTRVVLSDGRQTASGPDGQFIMLGVPAGAYEIAAIAPGCIIAQGRIAVPENSAVIVRLSLATPSAVSDGRSSDWSRDARRQGAAVHVITAADIRRMHATSISDVIRNVVPDMVAGASGTVGAPPGLKGRGRTTITGSTVPLVVIDGVRAGENPGNALQSLNPEDVVRIEIVRGASGGWDYGLGGVNGVVRVFTRRGPLTSDPVTDAADCPVRFAERLVER